MQFLTKKKFLFKLIVALCIVLTIFNFIITIKVRAEGEIEKSLGGKVLNGLISLVVGLGDGAMGLIHDVIMGEKESYIAIDTNTGFISFLFAAGTALLVTGALIAITIATTIISGGTALAAIPAVVGALGSTLVTGGIAGVAAGVLTYSVVAGSALPEVTLLPLYSIGPQEIFEGKILLFDVNVFNPKEVYVDLDGSYQTLTDWKNAGNSDTSQIKRYVFFKDGNPGNTSEENIVITSNSNAAYELKNAVAEWYYTLRTIAIVLLALVLIYIGIKTVMSATANENSKYKQMFLDWLIGIILLFFLHYFMIFAVTLTEKVTNLLSSSMGEIYTVVNINKANGELINKLKEQGFGDTIDDNGNINWGTNMVGKIRIMSQLQQGFSYVGYSLCYLVLVIFTYTFTFIYLKRLLYIVFLIVISPFICVTYPIDKIIDGKAQGFDMWMKEFVFNLIIQPFHLLLYYLLVGMAIDLANANVLYSIVAIGFMIPAEQFLRKMFGFSKASSPGFLSGAAGAAATMTAIQTLGKFASKGFGGKNSSKSSSNGEGKDKINFQDNRGIDEGHSQTALYNQVANESNGNNSTTNNQPKQDEKNQNSLNDEERQKILQNYKNDGYGQNANGEYYNPNTDEYDPDYNPFNDSAYNLLNDVEDNNNPTQESETTNKDNDSQENGAAVDIEEDEKNETNDNDLEDEKNIKKDENKEIRNRAVKYIGKSLGLGAVKFTGKGIKALGKGAAVAAGGAVGGVLAGTVGLAAGIATGDVSKGAKVVASMAGSGAAITAGMTKTGLNINKELYKDQKQKQDKAARAIYGDKYSEKMREESDRKFEKDKELRKLYAEKLKLKTKEDIDKAMKDAVEYRKWGVTDNETIIRAMKMDNGKDKNRISTERIAAARLAISSKTEKDLETNMKRFGKTKGITKEQTEHMEALVRKINFKEL